MGVLFSRPHAQTQRLSGRSRQGTGATNSEETIPQCNYITATQLARKIRQRKISSREALTYSLTRIEALDKSINSVVTIDA